MKSKLSLAAASLLTLAAAHAAPAATPKAVYESAAKSLVVVQYNWDFELGAHEITAPAVVISEDGLVMCSAASFDDRVPEKQIKDVKIIIPQPGKEPLELAADYQGRDDKAHVAFVKLHEKHALTPIAIAKTPCDVGDEFFSVGLMGKPMGYKPFLVRGGIAAAVPGERTQMLTDGSLAGFGAPVLNTDGEMIGFVDSAPQMQQSRRGQGGQGGGEPQMQAPSMFTPVADFADAIAHPPTPEKPAQLPWFGVFEMSALKADELSYYGLDGAVVQIGSIAAAGPAEKAGLKQGDLITAVDGKPLDRGDTLEQAPALFRRRLLSYKPGDTMKVTVVSGKGTPAHDVSVTFGASPARPSQMERFYADDLGFGVREMAFVDRYLQKVDTNGGGVLVSLVKPDGAAAAAHMQPNTLVLKLNNTAVTNLADFSKQYAAVRAAQPQDAVILLVRQEGHDETLRIEPAK